MIVRVRYFKQLMIKLMMIECLTMSWVYIIFLILNLLAVKSDWNFHKDLKGLVDNFIVKVGQLIQVLEKLK